MRRVESVDFLELSVKCFVREFVSQINILSDCGVRVIMGEQVKVGLRGQVVIPKKLRNKTKKMKNCRQASQGKELSEDG